MNERARFRARRLAAMAGRFGLAAALGLALRPANDLLGQQSRFAQTNSRSQYVHWIDLYDAKGRRIHPDDPNSLPYSPARTCGKCHDYQAIAQGYHFNAADKTAQAGRAGEPWVWTDLRTGTQIPLSYRGWRGTCRPQEVGISARQFLLKFGRHLPGGGPGPDQLETGEGTAGKADPSRWRLSGPLEIDCMLCHSNDRSYSPEAWAKQVADENFAWAPTAAMGLAEIRGSVKRLKDDFDPDAVPAGTPGPRLPQVRYRPDRFNNANKVFFDIAGTPSNNACYYCHTVRQVGADAAPVWLGDEDVHLKAGLLCVDCHRNGIAHHTVRGFQGELHPTGQPVDCFSCRGCHLGGPSQNSQAAGTAGRFGAPKPLHKGLPPVHLEKMSCTSCHAGPPPQQYAELLQTSMAHELGLPAHRHEDLPPAVVSPVLMPDESGVLYPYRMMWPAFWGVLKKGTISPLNPDEVYSKLRRVLRVRRNFTDEIAKVRLSRDEKAAVLGPERASVGPSELSAAEQAKLDELTRTKAADKVREKLTQALQSLAESDLDGQPVYISGGKAYRLGEDASLAVFEHEAAQPYAWPLAHDVRPGRQSLGVNGCSECHRDGAPIFYGTVTARGPAPDDEPSTRVMYQMEGFDPNLLAAWNRSFQGRTAFKWTGVVSIGAVLLVLLLLLALALNGLYRFGRHG